MRITLVILLILSVLCSKITDSNNSVLVIPSICFLKKNEPVTPEYIKKIIISVEFGDNVVRDTFNFNDHKGTVTSLIPKNTPFSLKLEALDNNSIVIYYSGILDYPGFEKDATVSVKANQVTPKLPENLTMQFLSNSTRILQWQDNSTNEEGFIIQKSVRDTNRFIAIDTVDTNIFVDTSTIKNASVCHYQVMAFNSVGQSPFVRIPFDPKDTVSTPRRPTLLSDTINIEIFYINIAYAFKTELAKCKNGSAIAYQFAWGDGTLSDWLSKQSSSYTWKKKGVYRVRCRIKCSSSEYIDVISNWSEPLDVMVFNR